MTGGSGDEAHDYLVPAKVSVFMKRKPEDGTIK